MESIYIKEKENCTRKEIFFLKLFCGKRNFKKYLFHTEEIDVLCIPFIPKERYYKKISNYLKKLNVKKVYTSIKKDNPFVLYMKKEFTYMEPDETLSLFFKEIISFFAHKKGIELKECTLSFICNDVLLAEKILSQIYKEVKGISIYTKEKEKFTALHKKWRETCGMDLEIKGKDDKVKKYNHIYINLEKELLFQENFFMNTNCIDIYHLYKGAYNEIIMRFKTASEACIKEHKIIKNFTFTDYYMQKNNNLSKKHYKIVNIKKLY